MLYGVLTIATALSHQTPDRVPIQISFTPEFADRLRRELRIAGAEDRNNVGLTVYFQKFTNGTRVITSYSIHYTKLYESIEADVSHRTLSNVKDN